MNTETTNPQADANREKAIKAARAVYRRALTAASRSVDYYAADNAYAAAVAVAERNHDEALNGTPTKAKPRKPLATHTEIAHDVKRRLLHIASKMPYDFGDVKHQYNQLLGDYGDSLMYATGVANADRLCEMAQEVRTAAFQIAHR